MRPHRDLRLRSIAPEERHQGIKGVGHVRVADVPRRVPPAKHRAVVLFRIERQTRVLFGEEEFLPRDLSIAIGVSAARRRSSVN